ncbi:MAG: T9SS type A sorting domain-containing protein [Flavobacteriales bacterium]|nr:T9SS type A sorting domain-containing protein [Flavobacteriales bacterium]
MNRFLSIAFLLTPFFGFSQCSVSLGDDIVQCNGNPFTLEPVYSGGIGQDSLRIVYDATQGQSGLVGASQVYIHSGIQTVPFGPWEYVIGNWGLNDGVGQMTSLGNNLWSITLNVEDYYGYPGGTNVIGLWMIFRNGDGSASGRDNNGNDIFLETSNNNASTFGGVSATDIAGGTGSFSWSTGAQTTTINVTQSGSYTVTYTDGLGCVSTDEIQVTFGSGNVQVNLGPDMSLCDGESITLDAGSGFSSYDWSSGASTQTLVVTEPGDYAVTVTDQAGCTGIDLINIQTGTSPVADFEYNAVVGTTVSFTDIGSGATTIYWDFNGDGNTDATSAEGASVEYDFGSESVFGVVMIAENGCGADTSSQNVLVQDVGIEELKSKLGFSAYPNPVNEQVSFGFSNQSALIQTFAMMDVQGRVIFSKSNIVGTKAIVDLSSFIPGTYLLKVETSEGIIYERILKQ